MRYLFTLRGSYNKTHFVTGRGELYVANCGLSWKRDSAAFREATRIRAHPIKKYWRKDGKVMSREWPHPYPGVTCGKCKRLPPPPFFNRNLPQTQEGAAQNGSSYLLGRERGGMDVDSLTN